MEISKIHKAILMCVLSKQNVLYFLYKCTTERLILNVSLVNHIIFRNDYFF